MSTHELSLDQLDAWVEELFQAFSSKQLVLLNGDLGAGKTEFVKRVLNYLECDEVASPTYGLIHEYKTSKRSQVFHIDLYRIDGEDDLESSGFWDLFTMEEGLVFVEWAERAPRSHFPLHWEITEIEIKKSENPEIRQYSVVKKSP